MRIQGSRLLLLVFAVLLPASQGAAEIYRWTDADGRVHFSDRPVADRQASRVELPPVNSFRGVRVEELPTSVYRRGERWVAPDVVIYGADWCKFCLKAKAYFDAKGIQYQNRDIDVDQSARDEYDALGGNGIPLILVGDGRMSGFSEAKFLKLYER